MYFRYFFNFSEKSRLFLYDLPFFSQFYENFGPKKAFFFLSRALWPPKKRVKRVKKVLHVLFQKVHRLAVLHPKYRLPIVNRGKVIQNGGFYTAPLPHMCLVSPCTKSEKKGCSDMNLWEKKRYDRSNEYYI